VAFTKFEYSHTAFVQAKTDLALKTPLVHISLNLRNTHLSNLNRVCEGGELFYHITKKKFLSEA